MPNLISSSRTSSEDVRIPDYKYAPGSLVYEDDMWEKTHSAYWLVVGISWCQKTRGDVGVHSGGGYWQYVLLGRGYIRHEACWEVNNSSEWQLVVNA